MNPILIAGIGNIFLGDDGFGSAVLGRLAAAEFPPNVTAKDYGIRGVHLAYDLLDGDVETLIMVDALPADEPAGTVSLFEIDDEAWAELIADPPTVDSHVMHPGAVLAALHALGGRVGRVLIVGCEPASLDPVIGLSAPVAAAVDPAAELALETAAGLLTGARDG